MVFSTYATYVVMSFMMLVMIFMLCPQAQVSAERINEVLETVAAHHRGHAGRGPGAAGRVEFRDVSFRYPNAKEDELEHISFKVGRGRDARRHRRDRLRQDDARQPDPALLRRDGRARCSSTA